MHRKLLVIIVVLIALVMPVATFITTPKQATVFSENENRYLTRFVKPNKNNLTDRRFMDTFDEWFADRFIMREEFIIAQNTLERLQGKSEINGVFTADDRLILSWKNTAGGFNTPLQSVDNFVQQIGIESYIMLVPTAQEIYADTLPPNSEPGNQTALIKHCYDNLPNLTSIDVATYLTENSDGYIFYRTDHHWTTYGAYWGYYAAALKMGIVPYDVGKFSVEHASTDFRGTLFSKTLDYRITPDVVSFYTLANNPPELTLTVNDGVETVKHDSLYLRDYLNSKDKYAAFMGVNSPIMEIETDVDNDRALLVFKDSYAHCMLPFLSNHYSRITVLDMRYINVDVSSFVDFSEYEQVLFVYSATEFAEDTSLRKLGLTGKGS